MNSKEIKFLRKEIDKITEKIIKLIAERRKIVYKIREIKKKKGMPVLDLKRERKLINNSKKLAKKFRVSPILIEKIMKILIKNGRKLQN